MRKLLDWLTAQDEHGDSPISYLIFVLTFVVTIMALASMPGY